MRFGPLPVAQAEGAVLAHAVKTGTLRLKKAQRLTREDVANLLAAGVATVVAAVFDHDDLDENEAAERVASALSVRNVEVRPAATGRVNLYASVAGVFTVSKPLVDAINAIDPAITVATLAPFVAVRAGQMVATVKIIPFAVGSEIVDEVAEVAASGEAIAVAPFRAARVALIQTEGPGLKTSVLDKTAATTQARLARSGSRIVAEQRIPHEDGTLAQVLSELAGSCDLLLVFGASAVSDPQDVIPAAIRMAGGVVKRVGMPVDPGNLLVLGELHGKPVIGAPGCARSPKENGFDWVLDRLLAGLQVTEEDIAGMGVGGLLAEIPARPRPREDGHELSEDLIQEPTDTGVHAIILAAGRSSRMGRPNKLLARFNGKPLIRCIAERVLASSPAGVTVVVGHQGEVVQAAVSDLPLRFVHNPAYQQGLATSLQTGIASLPPQASGAMIVLGDMPGIEVADLRRMLEAFAESGEAAIIRATHAGKRGNPAILPRASFAEIRDLHGDVGARTIIESGAYEVIDVELGEAASLDVDTPEAMALAGGVLAP
jgi:molybdenum cofactor cytidylyltransferase